MNVFPWYATELFLRVCEAGGLSAASRFGKIGISQPALSGQMNALEHHLGVKLFQRKPFVLTSEGVRFQEEALRLSTRMNLLCDAVTTDSGKPLRIAASDVIIRDYLPMLIKKMDPSTRTRLVLREAQSQDLPSLVRDGEADLGIGLLSRYVRMGSSPLVDIIARLPLVLLVPPSYQKKVTTWPEVMQLLRQKAIPSLVALPQSNLLMQHIHSALRKLGIEWHATVEVSSLSNTVAYVELDFGFGFGIEAPEVQSKEKSMRYIEIPPEMIPAVELGVWHTESLDASALRLLSLIRNFAKAEISTK